MLKLHTKRDFSWLVSTGAVSTSSIVLAASGGFTVEYNGPDGDLARDSVSSVYCFRTGAGLAQWITQAEAEADLLTALVIRRAGKYGVLSRDALLETFLIVVDGTS